MRYIITGWSYKDKYANVNWLRILEPFVIILDGLVSLILLPTPCMSYIMQTWYRYRIRSQCNHAIKDKQK